MVDLCVLFNYFFPFSSRIAVICAKYSMVDLCVLFRYFFLFSSMIAVMNEFM